MTPAAPTSKTVLARGLNLHYLDWGGEERQPMLLLHGLHRHNVMHIVVGSEVLQSLL